MWDEYRVGGELNWKKPTWVLLQELAMWMLWSKPGFRNVTQHVIQSLIQTAVTKYKLEQSDGNIFKDDPDADLFVSPADA